VFFIFHHYQEPFLLFFTVIRASRSSIIWRSHYQGLKIIDNLKDFPKFWLRRQNTSKKALRCYFSGKRLSFLMKTHFFAINNRQNSALRGRMPVTSHSFPLSGSQNPRKSEGFPWRCRSPATIKLKNRPHGGVMRGLAYLCQSPLAPPSQGVYITEPLRYRGGNFKIH